MASAGALVAFGRRDGDATKAFRNAGRMLLETGADSGEALPILATAVGVVHHIAVALLWGVLLLLIVRRFRGWAFAAAALLTSVAFTLLNLWVVPPAFGIGYAVVTSVGRALPLALALALALLVTPWASGVPEQRMSSDSGL